MVIVVLVVVVGSGMLIRLTISLRSTLDGVSNRGKRKRTPFFSKGG